jgi:hypothetical protein
MMVNSRQALAVLAEYHALAKLTEAMRFGSITERRMKRRAWNRIHQQRVALGQGKCSVAEPWAEGHAANGFGIEYSFV